MPTQELRSRMDLPSRFLEAVLQQGAGDKTLRVAEKYVALATHRVAFDAATQTKVSALLEQFARAPYNPPSTTDAESAVGAEALNTLVEQGTLERIAPNVLLSAAAMETMQAWVMETLGNQPEITAAQVRDRFGTSRKYAIAFLEYLDAKRVTRRVGDARVLR